MPEVMFDDITLEDLETVNFEGSYTDQLEHVIACIYDELKLVALDVRISIVYGLIEQYHEDTGAVPKSAQLDRLGQALSYEFLEGDRRADKMTLEEFPVLTDAQWARRKTGQYQHRNSYGQHRYEVPLEHASNYSADHVDFSLPVRKF